MTRAPNSGKGYGETSCMVEETSAYQRLHAVRVVIVRFNSTCCIPAAATICGLTHSIQVRACVPVRRAYALCERVCVSDVRTRGALATAFTPSARLFTAQATPDGDSLRPARCIGKFVMTLGRFS